MRPAGSPASALSPGLALGTLGFCVLSWATAFVLVPTLRGAGVPLGIRGVLLMSQVMLALPAVLALRAARVWPFDQALSVGGTVRAALLGFTFWITSLGLLQIQQTLWPPPPGYLETFRQLHHQLRPATPLDAAASVTAIGLAPALCEELVFRGMLLPALAAWGSGPALLVSAALFGGMHVDLTGQGAVLYRVPFAFAIGLGLGYLRLRSGSLLAPMVAHGVLNTLTYSVVAAGAEETPAGELPLRVGATILLAGIALSALLLGRMKR